MTTVLTQKRGEPFKYRFTFGNGWIGPMFTGGVRFTVRTRIPGSDVPDDTDDGVVYAAKNGSGTPFSVHDAVVPDFVGAGFLYGTVLLYLLGVETPYNMGAEFLSVRKSGPKMVVWGSAALVVIYLLTTLGTMMALPGDEIDPVTGVIGMLDVAGFPGLMEIGAIVLAFIVIVALMTYQVAYSRLIFVSGLERHLPRIFTHLNPRTRNPVSAILIQGAGQGPILAAVAVPGAAIR